MRLIARTDLAYLGKVLPRGAIFDAPDRDALEFINTDQAHRFNLEDPSLIKPEAPPTTEPEAPVVTLTPTLDSQPAAGGAGTFAVAVTPAGTSWSVENTAAWVTIVAPVSPQTLDGPVDYTVDPNVDVERIAELTVNGSVFTITQDAPVTRDATEHHGRHHR